MIDEGPNNNPPVIYSFEGRWEEPIRRGEVSVFFRKRRPVKLPNRVFIYLGVPVKSIIGYAKVDSITQVSLEDAVKIRGNGAITENELVKYFGDRMYVHAIWIGEVELFRKPLGLYELSRDFNFNPPQSFSIVSAGIEAALTGQSI